MNSFRFIRQSSTRDRVDRCLSRTLLTLTGGFWLFSIAAGFFVLEKEEFTPEANAPIQSVFPVHSGIRLAPDKFTLLLFAHPLCPCTRASFHELDELLAETGNKVSVVVVFAIPKGVPPGWEQGELWTRAEKMKGARICRDQDGVETHRFGVEGSGHVLLYNPAGELLFSGGITPSRGHEGENEGRSAIASLVLTGHSSVSRTPVFDVPSCNPPFRIEGI